jgi:hypothetical protein
MELFTLELTSKIDFGLQHSTLEKWLQRRYRRTIEKLNGFLILTSVYEQCATKY